MERHMSDNADFANARLTAANNWFQEEIKRLRLTDAERKAIREAADAYALDDLDSDCDRIAATLRGLLERTK
jgi:hypothetical protein